MLSCEFCEIFKKTFLIEHLWATASEDPLTLTRLRAFLHINCRILNNDSPITGFLKTHPTSIDTQSKAFAKSKKKQITNSLRLNISVVTVSQNKHGVCSFISWHETKLRLTNIHLLSYQFLSHSLSYLLDLIC